MGQVTLIFHGRLNDFLRNRQPEEALVISFSQKTALKHLIEACGVPHPEVGEIKVGGGQWGLDYDVQDGDLIHIHPGHPSRLAYEASGPRFIMDNHLGKLADYLRLLGFDVIYARDWPDDQIAATAHAAKRILLTRDRGLLKRKIVDQGYCVRADDPEEQLAEVVQLYDLNPYVTPFQRCLRCNGRLSPVNKEKIFDQLLPLTRKYYDAFTQCQNCGKIYWKGSHFEHMQTLLKPYLSHADPGEES